MGDIVVGNHVFHSKEELFDEVEKTMLWRQRTVLAHLSGNLTSLPDGYLNDRVFNMIMDKAYWLGYVPSNETCEAMCRVISDIIQVLAKMMRTSTDSSKCDYQRMIDIHTDNLNQFKNILKQRLS